jgi:phosphate transport system ATP-binding protein
MTSNGNGIRLLVKGLDFSYGKHKALKNVNCGFPDHAVTALIGPSGCGKSTLLRIFNRIFSLYPEQKATGEVLLSGQNILNENYDVNDLRARVGNGDAEADAVSDVGFRQRCIWGAPA